MKILILKPSSLGDVIQALPVLRLLKRHLPSSQVYWWIDAGLAPLLEGDPDLAGLFRFERQRWASPENWAGLWNNIRTLRALEFDWVIDLQSLARSGLVAWLANGRLTIGLDDAREGARGLFDIIVPRPAPDAHAVDWYLSVLPRLGVPVSRDLEWLPARPALAAAVRHKWQTAGIRWVILKPGARWENKRWPVQHYAGLVSRFSPNHSPVRFAIIGGAADRELGAVIARANPQRCLDLTGQTSLAEMIEWIRLGECMVTNDTGPMHVAAALGKRVLALFGPTNPRRTGPYGGQHTVLQLAHLPCAPCMQDVCTYEKPCECLRGISPATVAEWLEQQMASGPGS